MSPDVPVFIHFNADFDKSIHHINRDLIANIEEETGGAVTIHLSGCAPIKLQPTDGQKFLSENPILVGKATATMH